ncbi:nucleoid-associated protein [Flavobacterium collinsii]|uniref:Nucleoid-associated protein YejK n=1 Tax=Flavobacterium collinsii TaxID=1114861 RepID=A0ABM8KR41_9FLAO|nr:nucleoid-associated protein [Flavobacterium collinsii]CAA9203504.1 Nucleoid-associated protein YejK [Flavobacterium collinsii]
MEIKILKYTIHFIKKEFQKIDAQLDLSQEVMMEDEFSVALITLIHKSITESSSLKNTHFKDNESNLFTNSLNDYLATDENDEFYKFSESLSDLKDKIEKVPFATGGYYLFVDYTVDEKRYITVVLLRQKAGINISKISGTYKLITADNINIDKIAMACRVNLQILSETEDDRNYLALITTQQDGVVSKYFREWVLAAGYIKNDKNTSNLVSIIKSIDLPTDELGKPRYHNQNDFQKAVYEYAKSKADKTVNLIEMGKHFYGEQNEMIFLEYAAKHSIILDTEFVRHPAKWKTLVTIRAKVEGVEINVDYSKINKDYVVLEDNRIIINSQPLVNQIKKQYSLLDDK